MSNRGPQFNYRTTIMSDSGKTPLFGMGETPPPGAKVQPAKVTKNLLYGCLCSYMGALSFGYMIGYTSPAIPMMSAKEEPLTDDSDVSWFGSIATFGAMFGCLLAGWLVEKAGRRGALFVSAIPYLVGWGLIALCTDVSLLCVGRLLTGLSSGMITVVSPMYVAETATKDMRGMLGSGVQLAITVGILLVNILGMHIGWRALATAGALIPMVGLILTARVPDTPRYYLARGRKQDAVRALTWLRGPQGDAEEECRDMEESLDTEEKITWGEFLKPQLLQPLKVSVGLMIFQQLSGINVVMFYTVSIFQSAGYKENGQLAAVIIGVVQVAGTVVACVLMDRAGRRVLLTVAGAGMTLTCFTMGYYYYVSQGIGNDQENPLSWLALASLIVYTLAFSLGWGPIPMLVMSEIFPVKARGTASAISAVTNWAFAFLITKEFSYLQATLGQYGAFWFFGGCTAIGMLFVFKKVPETKGKTLEDIELYFLGRAIRGI